MNTAEHTANLDKFFADAVASEASGDLDEAYGALMLALASEFFALNPDATIYTLS
jgi:hypothetical protein|tara:strand:- start:2325 stop:2489 length:165 start_codon:yes stop_codon:yes gene_type:complete